MFHSIILSRAILLLATVPICMNIGGKINSTKMHPQVVSGHVQIKSTAGDDQVQHIRKSHSEAFPAKSPTECTWEGGTGNWEDAGSWSCGHVPTVENDVEIFVGTVTLNSVAQVNTLVIGTGAGLIVATGKSITIYH